MKRYTEEETIYIVEQAQKELNSHLMDCLNDTIDASELIGMKHADRADMQKLRKLGYVEYRRGSQSHNGWQMTDKGFQLWHWCVQYDNWLF